MSQLYFFEIASRLIQLVVPARVIPIAHYNLHACRVRIIWIYIYIYICSFTGDPGRRDSSPSSVSTPYAQHYTGRGCGVFAKSVLESFDRRRRWKKWGDGKLEKVAHSLSVSLLNSFRLQVSFEVQSLFENRVMYEVQRC